MQLGHSPQSLPPHPLQDPERPPPGPETGPLLGAPVTRRVRASASGRASSDHASERKGQSASKRMSWPFEEDLCGRPSCWAVWGGAGPQLPGGGPVTAVGPPAPPWASCSELRGPGCHGAWPPAAGCSSPPLRPAQAQVPICSRRSSPLTTAVLGPGQCEEEENSTQKTGGGKFCLLRSQEGVFLRSTSRLTARHAPPTCVCECARPRGLNA